MFSQPYVHEPIVFGSLPLPVMNAAINEANGNLKTPHGMGVMVALAAASLTTQGLVDVKLPTGQEVAASVMALIVANSGERKSAMEAIFLKTIRQWEELNRAKHEEAIVEYKRAHRIWKVEHDVREKAFKKRIAKGEAADAEMKELEHHLDREPFMPVLLKLLYEDSTLPALFHGLREVPIAGLISSEGGGILEGPIFNEQTRLNALWSGSSVSIDRVSTESFVLSGVRLTVLVMVQPGILKNFLAEKGERARDSGLLARMLICNTGTTQGTRIIHTTTATWKYCERFNQRMQELLDENMAALKDPTFKRKLLKLSPQAEAEWVQYYNQVESNIHAQGHYALAGDHASKLAENVGRVAAILHKLEDFEGDISLSALRTAILIVNATSQDFINLVTPAPELNEALVLDDWLTKKYRSRNVRYVSKSMVRRYGPNSFRNTILLDHIVNVLVDAGKVGIERRNKTIFLDLFPSMTPFTSFPMMTGGI